MYLFFSSLLLFAAVLFQLDRHFLKQNDGFCLRTILGQVPFQEKWEIEAPLSPEVQEALSRPFHYLAKGHQSYVFESEDGKRVIKFYRFPSHMRVFPWLNHPLSYHFSHDRRKIMAYNQEKLDLSFNSYKIAFEELRNETGIEWAHLNLTPTEHSKVHLIDRTGNHYHVPLGQLSCVVQKRFTLIFDTLETMRANHDKKGIQAVVSSLLNCIADRCREGIVDNDPVLGKNYGWDGSRVVYIDIGRFVHANDSKILLNAKEQALQITPILADWLQGYDEELFKNYNEMLNNLD
ncbi:MAG: hypothetical protein JSR39_07010 [Verrucomicrobia bacterium]|nr:hypothetical protein [Verrucomicrobiota bacterium]